MLGIVRRWCNLEYAFKSDRGKARENNEDSFCIITGLERFPNVFIIADGMGGHNSGEVASRTAVATAEKYIRQYNEELKGQTDIQQVIRDAITETNTAVYNQSMENIDNLGMGTTFVMAVVTQNMLHVGHVGDSRAYLIRGDGITQITTDHSFVEEMVRNGSITREEAENHPQKNLITRALGCSEEIQIDLYSCKIFEDDCILLCTDGLTNMLSEEEILSTVLEAKDMDTACSELVNKANDRGGHDNITVIAIRNN